MGTATTMFKRKADNAEGFDPQEVAGYAEYSAAAIKAAELESQLRSAESTLGELSDPKRKDAANRAAAESLLAGGDIETADVSASERAKLARRAEVLREALALAKQRADIAKRAWSKNCLDAATPIYRQQVRAYIAKLIEAAAAARQIKRLNDALEQSLELLASPTMGLIGSNILGDVNDATGGSRIRRAMDEAAEHGFGDVSEWVKMFERSSQ